MSAVVFAGSWLVKDTQGQVEPCGAQLDVGYFPAGGFGAEAGVLGELLVGHSFNLYKRKSAGKRDKAYFGPTTLTGPEQ